MQTPRCYRQVLFPQKTMKYPNLMTGCGDAFSVQIYIHKITTIMKAKNKKQYKSPTTDVVELKLENSVLTGSADVNYAIWGAAMEDYSYGTEVVW